MTNSLGTMGGGVKNRHVLVLALMIVAMLVIGCNEPVQSYRTTDSNLASGDKVLVLPFMDARTFTDPKDPYRENLGNHARDIFVAAFKDHNIGKNRQVLTPALAIPDRSMTIAEVAEIGRGHGADYVIAGQMFSYTETRAASIPPRAGMFVRVVSVKDGSLAFVGDHYQSASVPGASGGRELQARQVADRLLDSMVASANAHARGFVTTSGPGMAFASFLPSIAREMSGNNDSSFFPAPPPPLPDFNDDNTEPVVDSAAVPEVPKLFNYGADDDFYSYGKDGEQADLSLASSANAPDPRLAEILPPPAELTVDDAAETEVASAENDPTPEVPPVVEPEVPALAVAESEPADEPAIAETPAAAPAATEKPSFVVTAEPASALLTGDELAADLFEEEGVLDTVLSARSVVVETQPEPAETIVSTEESAAEMVAEAAVEAAMEPPVVAASERTENAAEFENDVVSASGQYLTQRDYFMAIGAGYPDNESAVPFEGGAVVVPLPVAALPSVGTNPDESTSYPMAVEQPTPVHTLDNVAQTGNSAPYVATVPVSSTGSIKVLFLPYHDRDNPDNLIPNTGGGEVVTAIFGSRLATENDVQVLWAGGPEYSHQRLLSREEAIEYGRQSGADFVVRGQVVEFRRAQSVPSFYSVVISTAVLAAQIFFAEISGVDVATEIYRVSDGVCVMSRRDHAQQKYVVQAEKTVRRLASGMADDVVASIKDPTAVAMEPLIDDLTTTSQLASVR